jgi:hypothetical protein
MTKPQKSPAIASEALLIMVPRGGIEPPTRGFSIDDIFIIGYKSQLLKVGIDHNESIK